jgi:hypothetical protein
MQSKCQHFGLSGKHTPRVYSKFSQIHHSTRHDCLWILRETTRSTCKFTASLLLGRTMKRRKSEPILVMQTSNLYSALNGNSIRGKSLRRALFCPFKAIGAPAIAPHFYFHPINFFFKLNKKLPQLEKKYFQLLVCQYVCVCIYLCLIVLLSLVFIFA